MEPLHGTSGVSRCHCKKYERSSVYFDLTETSLKSRILERNKIFGKWDTIIN